MVLILAAIAGALLLTLIVSVVLLLDARKRLASIERDWPVISSRVLRDSSTVRVLREWHLENGAELSRLISEQGASPRLRPDREGPL